MSTERVSTVQPLPRDWPGPGPIDLSTHDLPHESSRVEWWYVNAHLTTEDLGCFSVFAAFFTVDVSDRNDIRKQNTHFLTWALTDVDGQRYFPETLLDARSPEIALAELEAAR